MYIYLYKIFCKVREFFMLMPPFPVTILAFNRMFQIIFFKNFPYAHTLSPTLFYSDTNFVDNKMKNC